MVGGMTRLLLISGSTLERSLHTAALRTVGRFAPPGVRATVYDELRNLPAFVPTEGEGLPTQGEGLPTGGGGTEQGEDQGPVARLRRLTSAADVVLFCTPEYAGTLPGSLKNLLDWLVEGRDLAGKWVAWLTVSPPGREEGARAALEAVLEHAGAQVLRSVCIRIPLEPGAVDPADPDGLVADPRLDLIVPDLLQALARRLAGPSSRQQPSWQAYSSVYPIVMRPDGGPRR
jgi:chromate reductase, NAD(P)H dehydrogenase (quinone)